MDLSPLIFNTAKNVSKQFYLIDKGVELIKSQLEKACPSPEELKRLIGVKNKLVENLTKISTQLEILTTTTSTVSSLIKGLNTTIKIIKAIPIPTSIPPGIGIPTSLIIKFSDILSLLKKVVEQGEGGIGGVKNILNSFKTTINNIITKLNSLDILFLFCLEEYFGETPTPEQLSEFGFSSTPNDIFNFLVEPSEIIDPNDLLYKNWKLEIQDNPYNKLNIPSRRVKGTEQTTGVVLYNYLRGKYSYSPKVSILIEEIKFKIDNYSIVTPLIQNIYNQNTLQ